MTTGWSPRRATQSPNPEDRLFVPAEHVPLFANEGAFSGAGMVILGVTCFDHQSDWEGMTVALECRAGRAEPIAAHYAQRGRIVRYDWPAVRAHWDRDTTLKDLFARFRDHADRPLVLDRARNARRLRTALQ